MPLRETLRNRTGCGLVYLAPFLLVLAWDLFVLRRYYYLVPNDSVTGMFGLGLNWLALHPWPTFHHPSYFFQQLTAPIIMAAGLPRTSLMAFFAWGIATHIVFLLAAAAWMAQLAPRLALSIRAVGIIALATATFPELLVGASQWGHYYPIGVLLPPLGLAILDVLGNERNRPGALMAPLFVLGFCVANYFPMLVVACAAGTAFIVLLATKDEASLRNWLGGTQLWGGTTNVAILFLFVFANVIFVLYKAIWHAPTYDIDDSVMLRSAALSAVLAAPATWLINRVWHGWPKCQLVFPNVFAPVAAGWLVGANVLSPFWLTTAVMTFLHQRGGSSPAVLEWPRLGRILETGWYALLIAAFVLPFCLPRSTTPRRRLTCVLLASVTIALSILISWRLLLESPSLPAWFGLDSRYLLMALPGAAALYAVWQARGRTARLIADLFIVGCCLVTLVQAQRALAGVTEEARVADRVLTSALTAFLAQNPTGLVVCLNAEAPEVCDVAYAWNRYRKPEGLAAIPQPSLLGGRVRYAGPACETATIRACLATPAGTPLAVVEATDRPGDTLVKAERLGQTISVFRVGN